MNAEQSMTQRTIKQIITAHHQKEGGGFMVRRPFPAAELNAFDPFLLIDEMGPVTYKPGEAVGAPDHPHRGFETVTYMLEGEMEHKDSAGNQGRLTPGDVQWMTAGSGVVHSEMPSPRMLTEGGRMHGFQIWVNIPGKFKMSPPRYQEISTDQIPTAMTADGLAQVRVIAGEALGVHAVIDTHIPIVYHDWTLKPGANVKIKLETDLNAGLYVFSGTARLGPDFVQVTDGQFAMLNEGSFIQVTVPTNEPGDVRFLMLAGKPIGEPVARYGPFVMNTQEELKQAFADYQSGRMGQIQSKTA